MGVDLISLGSIFFSGLLAGEELVIRFGVRGPLARLEQCSHIEMRQGLIRTLRVWVPFLFALTLLFSVAATIVHWGDVATVLRCASIGLLVTFISVALAGTVPINQAVITWNPNNPPSDWQRFIAQWEKLDTLRMWLAVIAFALALLAVKRM